MDALELQNYYEKGCIGAMIATEEKMIEFLDEEEIKNIERLFGPVDPGRESTGAKTGDRYDPREMYLRYTEMLALGLLSGSGIKEANYADKMRNKHWHEQKAKRAELFMQLAGEHTQFVNEMTAWINESHTMAQLQALIDQAAGHDKRLEDTYGKQICDSFDELADVFEAAEKRIRSAREEKIAMSATISEVAAVVADNAPAKKDFTTGVVVTKISTVLVRTMGGKLYPQKQEALRRVFSQRQLERALAEGFKELVD